MRNQNRILSETLFECKRRVIDQFSEKRFNSDDVSNLIDRTERELTAAE